MPLHFAFLRAVNIGGRTVRMEALRRAFEGAGFTRVETFIASGNVIFESPDTDGAALEGRIETVLRASLAFPVSTFVRSHRELHAIARFDPFGVQPERGKAVVHVLFLRRAPAASERHAILASRTDVDEFAVKGREIYWLVRGSFLDSKLRGGALEGAVTETTMRNRNTVVRLAAKYPI
jgi:uncharacterized protein (DUF1697 family)